MDPLAVTEAAIVRVRAMLASVQDARGWTAALGGALDSGQAADAYRDAVARLRELLGALEAAVHPLESVLVTAGAEAEAALAAAGGASGG